MKLADYQRKHNLTDEAFAALVERNRSVVTRWRNGVCRPDWESLAKIKKITKGEVGADDFMPGGKHDRRKRRSERG